MRLLWNTLGHVLVHHYDNIWNVFDSVINILVLIYLIMTYYVSMQFEGFRQNRQADLRQLWWDYEVILEIANIIVSTSLIVSWIRVLYFLLPIPVVGPLVIAVLRMNRDVAYFVLLMGVFIFGFSTIFDLIFAGYWDIYTGYWTAIFSTARLSIGNIEYSDSSVLLPLPNRWLGNVLIIIYALIAGILAVNFLVAMLGATFTELWETTEMKWHQLDGDLLLHYERFVFMPPPFNLFQNLVYVIYKLVCIVWRKWQKKKFFLKWELITKWEHEEELNVDPNLPVEEQKKRKKELRKLLRQHRDDRFLNFWYKDILKRKEEDDEHEEEKTPLENHLGNFELDFVEDTIEKLEEVILKYETDKHKGLIEEDLEDIDNDDDVEASGSGGEVSE